jgi:hypothetical protein
MKKTLYMETTEVPTERTAAEVCAELIKAGATQIATSYDSGKVRALRWTMKVGGEEKLFAMPARIEPLYQYFLKRAQNGSNWWANSEQLTKVRDKAERVAWRQLLRWVQSQLALIETGMVEAAEVFFPYWEPVPGRTVFAMFKDHELKALPPASGETQ